MTVPKVCPPGSVADRFPGTKGPQGPRWQSSAEVARKELGNEGWGASSQNSGWIQLRTSGVRQVKIYMAWYMCHGQNMVHLRIKEDVQPPIRRGVYTPIVRIPNTGGITIPHIPCLHYVNRNTHPHIYIYIYISICIRVHTYIYMDIHMYRYNYIWNIYTYIYIERLSSMHLACNCPRKWWFGDPHSWCQVFAKQRPMNSLLEATRWAGPLGAGWVQCWGKKGESTDGTPLLKLLSQGLECPRSEHPWWMIYKAAWVAQQVFWLRNQSCQQFFFELYNWLHRHPAPYFLFSRAGSHLGAQKLIPQNQVALDQPMTHFAARRAEDASFWIMVLDDCRRVDRWSRGWWQ